MVYDYDLISIGKNENDYSFNRDEYANTWDKDKGKQTNWHCSPIKKIIQNHVKKRMITPCIVKLTNT